MSERLTKTYGLQGEPETRIEREMENIYRLKLDAALTKHFTVPNVSTVPQSQPVLVKDAGTWYIYIRVDDTFHRTALTAV